MNIFKALDGKLEDLSLYQLILLKILLIFTRFKAWIIIALFVIFMKTDKIPIEYFVGLLCAFGGVDYFNNKLSMRKPGGESDV